LPSWVKDNRYVKNKIYLFKGILMFCLSCEIIGVFGETLITNYELKIRKRVVAYNQGCHCEGGTTEERHCEERSDEAPPPTIERLLRAVNALSVGGLTPSISAWLRLLRRYAPRNDGIQVCNDGVISVFVHSRTNY
jgi:hypothetical protein